MLPLPQNPPVAADDPPGLFDDLPPPAIAAAPATPEATSLAERLGTRFGRRWHLGTSSWHFPGWAGQVWQEAWPETTLSRHGLSALARHPLLRCVSLDRSFYRPLDSNECARLAAQVDDHFRFVVKAFAGVTDAMQRDARTGAPTAANPGFLDPDLAMQTSLRPALHGFGRKLGALVFQLSPLPRQWLGNQSRLHERLAAMFVALQAAHGGEARLALECRDPELLTPELAALLRQHGVRYCLGVHDRMPPIAQQLDMARRTWPGDLVCRWNLQRGQRYAQARDRWAPFDRLQAPDVETRQALARAIVGTLSAGHQVFVTINNKAEGSAPASVLELARAMATMCDGQKRQRA